MGEPLDRETDNREDCRGVHRSSLADGGKAPPPAPVHATVTANQTISAQATLGLSALPLAVQGPYVRGMPNPLRATTLVTLVATYRARRYWLPIFPSMPFDVSAPPSNWLTPGCSTSAIVKTWKFTSSGLFGTGSE